MRVVQWSSDTRTGGDGRMADTRLTMVVTDLRAGQMLFASGPLTFDELMPLEPLLTQLAASRRARSEAVVTSLGLPTFVAPRDLMPTPTVCRLVHVDLERQVALWELESRPPVSALDPLPAAAPEPHLGGRGTAPRRVVCVENDRDGAEVLRLTLEFLPNVEFLTASTGRDGLALLHQSPPSLLLVDLQLPDISGATIIELCRRSPALASMPVIVLTADASVPTRRAIEALGVTHLAIKPFDLIELRAVVEDLLAYD
ncbi:MAG: response regulator [Acidimicrobiales bacterium]